MSTYASAVVAVTAAKIKAILNGPADALMRAAIRAGLWDGGYDYKIHPDETAAGLTDANLTFGFRVGHVLRYGVKGDNATDDTAALQACYTANAGKRVDHGDELQILISATVNIYSGTRYFGKSVIRQKTGANIGAGASSYMLSGNALANVIVDQVEIDGNAANNLTGVVHGAYLSNGTNNRVSRINVHDTTQAGIFVASETDCKISANQVINCGRNLGTDNHGIMAISNTATPLQNLTIIGNTVVNAYRKGITTYSLAPGTIVNVLITGNTVSGCGLGGIYTGNGSGATTPQAGINITGNTCTGNYVNIELGQAANANCSNNICANDSGANGIYIVDVAGATVNGNMVNNSSVAGIKFGISYLAACRDITCNGNTVLFSNRLATGYGPGIDATNVQYSTIRGNTIDDTPGAAKQTYAISEGGVSDFNVIDGNLCANVTATLLNIVGANTYYEVIVGNQKGINCQTPANTLDVAGGISLREQVIALVNGPNENVALPAKAGTLVSNAPTAAYAIGGIAGGANGRHLTLINYTVQTMTLNHQDAGSIAANRLTLSGSVNLVVPAFGSVELVYSPTLGAWTKIG